MCASPGLVQVDCKQPTVKTVKMGCALLDKWKDHRRFIGGRTVFLPFLALNPNRWIPGSSKSKQASKWTAA